jgi:hypothetical protein
MLALSDFYPGTIADASIGSLILPRSKYEQSGIVASYQGSPFFVILSEDHRFYGFPSESNTSYKGLIIPGVAIEVDETSLAEHDTWESPLGSIVCVGSEVGIRSSVNGNRPSGYVVARLSTIPASRIEAAFTRWQITLGSGPEKRILMRIDAAQPKA